MKVTYFEIDGPILIQGKRHYDQRGYFSEIFKKDNFTELGLPDFVQDNVSKSNKNVFRGMHWQRAPQAQGKLVTCLRGSIRDFVTDIRTSSATFGQTIEVNLSSEELSSFWVPEGFSHGFLSLEDDTLVFYKVNRFWSQADERSMNTRHFSEKLPPDIILSDKDELAPDLWTIDKGSLFS